MSHNVILSGVKFNDMNLLGSIVTQLSKGTAMLDMTAKNFRTYPGQPTGCDAVIKMPGNHDIGLKHENGSYTPVFDPYSMSDVFQCADSGARIGDLTREYTLQQAEYEAAQNGMSTNRIAGKGGVVTLEILDHS